jgi:hypothetical protein
MTTLSDKADRHLWGHFARHGHGITAPIISRGEGCYIYDSHGKRYFDGLSGLFVVQVGHGRAELADLPEREAIRLRLDRFEQAGLIDWQGTRLRLNGDALPYARSIAAAFDAWRTEDDMRFSHAV